MNLKGKRIIVVGGSSGIGLGVARLALERGAEVVIVGRSVEKLRRAAAELASDGQLNTLAADITLEDAVARMFDSLGAFDHLITTAADLSYQPVREIDLASLRATIDSKLVAALMLAKHGAASINEKGSLTFTSGVAAFRPAPRGSMVAAVNGAINSLVKALALELAPVRVNAVSPGWVDTPIWERVAGANRESVQAQMAGKLPVGRLGTPEDLAQAYLAVVENEFITGTVFEVDGGHRLV